MSYTREQRAANAAKAAERAAAKAEQAQQAESVLTPQPEEPTGRYEAPEPPKLRNDPRDRAFSELEERHNKRAGVEEAPAEEPAVDATPTAVPSKEEAAAPVVAPAAEAPKTEPPAETPAPAVEMVTVKVDGEEFQVAKSEVEEAGGLVAYRVTKATQNRLKETREALAETKRTQAQTAQLAQLVQTLLQPKQPEQPKKSRDELIQAIRFGTPDEAVAAFEEMQGKPQQIDPNRLMAQTMIEISKNTAVAKFKQEFADIAGNDIALRAAVALDRERMQQAVQDGTFGPQFDFSEHYRKIGNEVRTAFGARPSQPPSVPALNAAPTASTPSQPSAKEERKSSIVNLPTAAARAALPEEENPGTPEEQRLAALNDMRKARGQPIG